MSLNFDGNPGARHDEAMQPAEVYSWGVPAALITGATLLLSACGGSGTASPTSENSSLGRATITPALTSGLAPVPPLAPTPSQVSPTSTEISPSTSVSAIPQTCDFKHPPVVIGSKFNLDNASDIQDQYDALQVAVKLEATGGSGAKVSARTVKDALAAVINASRDSSYDDAITHQLAVLKREPDSNNSAYEVLASGQYPTQDPDPDTEDCLTPQLAYEAIGLATTFVDGFDKRVSFSAKFVYYELVRKFNDLKDQYGY